ncbi:MAG: hypothetical protein WAN08_09265 [Candidatus Sulfotelmatobacter sp.]
MIAKTKAESSQDIVEAIDRLERRSDTCYTGLDLLDRQWNYAAWLSLTECVRRIEASLTPNEYGSSKHKILVMNLARVAGQLWKFAHDHGRPKQCAPSVFRWFPRVAQESALAFEVAGPYSLFCLHFPAWHWGLYSAEIEDATTIRFHVGSSQLARRVSAYGKGIRPGTATLMTVEELQELPSPAEALRQRFDDAIRTAKGRGRFAVKFGSLRRLRSALAEMYAERLSGRLRRYPSISVGSYSLEQFRAFYVGLLAVVGAHEHLCFQWARGRSSPIESLVMVHPRLRWMELISEYSGLGVSTVECILPDLTFGAFASQDLQMTPFVPLADDNSLLGVVPHFPLQSNWEENILRVCSYVRPKIYSQTSLTKEGEMRDRLKSIVKAPRLVSGPLNLGKGIPDLDLLVEDAASGTILLAELKWPRKPYSPREFPQRDSEIRKGIAQIKAIKSFLTANPGFLFERGYAQRSLNDYGKVQYCVVSRDHLIETRMQNIRSTATTFLRTRCPGLKICRPFWFS